LRLKLDELSRWEVGGLCLKEIAGLEEECLHHLFVRVSTQSYHGSTQDIHRLTQKGK
jgi:hypothetical protein